MYVIQSYFIKSLSKFLDALGHPLDACNFKLIDTSPGHDGALSQLLGASREA